MDSLSVGIGAGKQPEPEGKARLKSTAEGKLVRLKEDLVLQLFLGSGNFWEEIQGMRDRWSVKPETKVPLGNPIKPTISEEFAYYPKDLGDMEIPEINHWDFALDMAKGRVVPPRYSLASRWREFISACVLCDPPELGLVEFAKCGGVVFDVGGQQDDNAHDYEMVASPVRRLPYPYLIEHHYNWFINAMMQEIGERYLKRRGLNIHKMFSEVGRSGLYDELEKRLKGIPRGDFIEVDAHTAYPDVEAGFSIIASEQGRQNPGASERSPLVAIECALRHDRYNTMDPTDKRRWKWTFKSLAEEYKLYSRKTGEPAPGRAKAHVVYGRELLEKIG